MRKRFKKNPEFISQQERTAYGKLMYQKPFSKLSTLRPDNVE